MKVQTSVNVAWKHTRSLQTELSRRLTKRPARRLRAGLFYIAIKLLTTDTFNDYRLRWYIRPEPTSRTGFHSGNLVDHILA